ncbi:MAG: hypothetical protein JJU45_13565 [Acidimicrobiia bacterium]|nr:hypothetical protein [Acidimicrobiia bacterium]
MTRSDPDKVDTQLTGGERPAGTDDVGAEADDSSETAPSPVEGLLNPEEGVNSPAADADAQPPG